jgi:hypothetical protein
MKRMLAAAALTAAMALTGCSVAPADEAVSAEDAAVDAAAADAAPAASAAPAAVTTAAAPAAPGAPAFAVIYPGGATDGPATIAQGPTGPGGILTFTTDASPEAVVAFYRQRAEATGLTTIASLNQPGASAYSAGDGADGRGQLLNVVATPVEGGPTSVQLSWAAGR